MNNQQEQEERQLKIMEVLDWVDIQLHKYDYVDLGDKWLFVDPCTKELDFLASECGVGDLWRKRNGN